MKNSEWIKVEARRPKGWGKIPEIPPGIVVISMICLGALIVIAFFIGGRN